MTIQNPLFQPPSEWVCPEAIDYKGQCPVAIDLETYDPGIKDHGPGWATGNGKVVGVALAWEGFKGYFPIDHDAPGNYDKEVFKRDFRADEIGKGENPRLVVKDVNEEGSKGIFMEIQVKTDGNKALFEIDMGPLMKELTTVDQRSN